MKDCFQESTGSIRQWQLSSVKLTAEYPLTPNNVFHSKKREDEQCGSFCSYAYFKCISSALTSPDL